MGKKKKARRRPAGDDWDRPLPTAKSLGELSLLIYGYEKIGKTTLAKQFPLPYFLFTEPGHKSLIAPTHGKVIEDWAHFKRAVAWVVKSKYQTVVVDTADQAHELCTAYVCEKLAINHPSDMEWGKGWKAVTKEFVSVMQTLQKWKGTIFLSHATDKEFKTAAGGTRDRVVPTMTGAARKTIEPAVDVFACYTYDVQGNRALIIRGDLDVAAGCRCKKNFIGVKVIPMGGSEEESYANFLAAYENKQRRPARRKKQARKVSKKKRTKRK